jgi:hypothetical protein
MFKLSARMPIWPFEMSYQPGGTMSTLAVSIMPRSSKRLFAAVAACALLASAPVVAPTAADAATASASTVCDAKDVAKGKAKCDPFDGDGRKN